MSIKKIMTKSEIEKKNNRNKLIVGIVLVAVMVMSTLGYSLLSGEEEGGGTKITYNGTDFYKNGVEWQASINGQTLSFLYSPPELGNIKVPASVKMGQFNSKPLYFDSDNPSMYYEIARNLQYYVSKIDYACLNESDCPNEIYPIKTCSDNLIIIRNANQTSIKTENNCTFISGNESALEAGDAFLYKVLGVN